MAKLTKERDCRNCVHYVVKDEKHNYDQNGCGTYTQKIYGCEEFECHFEPILKACPFCGSTNIKIDKCVSRARCGDCMATSGLITKYVNQGMDNQEALITVWNTRADV